MTPQEAIIHIKKHNEAHSKKERFAVHITEALQMAVEALEKQQWIPVAERLPQKSGCYLVIRNFGLTGERDIAVFLYSEYCFPGKNMFSRYGTNDVFYNKSVTHWMPLPEPPEGE